MRTLAVVVAGVLAAVVLAPTGDAQTRQSHTRLVPAVTPGAPPLSCKASRAFSCDAAGCETTMEGDGVHVQLDLKTAEGKGYLCTFSYCRSFTLMGWRDRPKATGLVWSSASGSVPPLDRQPIYDFTLSVAENWQSFSLVGTADGKVSGYSGACGAPTP